MKLYLDDKRPIPSGWQGCSTAWECIWFLEHEEVTELSLDHDLGDGPSYAERPGTGYDVAKWLLEQAFNGNFKVIPQIIDCHSSNPKGREDILKTLKRMKKYMDEQ